MSQPSFYAIIPAHVRYCKEIESGAKLLYGELTALASQEGFCWASNKYLSDLYDVDKKTIQRWVSSLVDRKFIEIEVDKSGFQTVRRIWISTEIKERFTKGQKCLAGGTKVVGGQHKNVPYINTESNTSNKNTSISPKRIEREAFGEVVRLSKEEYQKAKELCGDALEDLIDQMNDHCEAHSKKYSNYLAAIRIWWKRRANDPKKKEDKVTANANWAVKFQAKMGKMCKFEALSKYAEFRGYGNAPSLVISYTENGFKEQVLNQTRKMGLIQFWKEE